MRSLRWGLVGVIVSLLAGAFLAAARPETASGLSNCSASQLVPALREVMVNQGVANYTYLVRGKETLVKFFLSNPTTCAVTSTQSINITAATLSVNNTLQTFSGIGAFQSFAAAPALSPTLSNNSSADPVFAVPANDLVPLLSNVNTNTFNPTFTATITYSRKSGTTTTPGQTVTYSNSTPVTFDHATGALRVLVVPMGDGTPGVLASTQYTATDQTATQNGFSALSRIFPVPSGVASLGPAGGGIRYTIDLSTMLNLKAVAGAYDANGKFCGAGVNFDGIKAQLAQFMQSWNSNPLNVDKQVDRVLGVVGEGISDGANSPYGCADGMASVVSPEAWARAISDKPASGKTAAQPSRTGSLMAMELTHTWGGATTPSFHSANVVADGTDLGRAYNVTTRSYLATNRSAMKYSFVSSPPWDDTLTLLEPAHYAFDRCAFGGTTTTDCAGVGSTVGTTSGVLAGSSFVVSGIVHSSTNPPTAEIVQSGFLNSLQLGQEDSSPYRYVRRDSAGHVLTNIGFHVSFTNSLHAAGTNENDDPGTSDGLFSFALPDGLPSSTTDLAEVQLWKVTSLSHTPGADPNDVDLYDKKQQATPPQVLSISSGAAAGATKYTDTPTVNEKHPALSDDTNWVAWNQPSGTYQRIKVAPATNSLQAVEVPSPDNADAIEPAWNHKGTALAYESNGALYTVSVDLTGATPTFGSPNPVYTGNPPAHHPTWSFDGKSIAFDRAGDIYKMQVLPNIGPPVQLTNNGEQESDPSWSHTDGVNLIAYNRGPTGCDLCFPATKLYVVKPESKFPQTKINDDGAFPSFGTNGRIAFVRHSDRNIWSTNPDGTDAKQLTTGGDDTLPSAAGSGLAFDRIFTPPGQADIMLTGLSGGQAVTFTAQSNVPLKAELDYECNGTAYPVRVGLVPDEINGAVQTFNTNFDGSISCGGGVLRALVTDGVQYASGTVFTTTVAAKAPTAAIFTPVDAVYPQRATFALSGTGYDAEGRVLPASNLHWTLTLPNGSPYALPNSGNFASTDLQAPSGGWPVGTLTFTLVASDGTVSSLPVTRNVQVQALFDFVGGGFLPPIVNPPQVNVANSGSTIPIKWQLQNASGYISDLATVQSVTYQTSDCFFTQPFGSTPIALPTGGTFLRYDTSTNQFVYNWALVNPDGTPLSTSPCYVFTLVLTDGTLHQAYFDLR